MSTLHVQCGNGHWVITGSHASPDADLVCPPGEGCCELDHDHAAAANACPETHEGHPCPQPESCRTFAGGHVAPTGDPDDFSGPMNLGTCPGGHHGLGVTGCTVCRPVTITALPGAFGDLQPATGG